MVNFSFSKKTDLIWFLGLSIGLGMTLISSFATPWPAYKMGQFWVYAMILIRVIMYPVVGRYEDTKIFQTLFTIGIVTGFVELLADYWLVNGISSGRLVYHSRNDVILLASPLWMPFAWALVTVEFGYPILRLIDVLKKPFLASLIGACNAGIGVGFYEYLANASGWWYYEPAKKMIGSACAVYIPFGEFLLFLSFYFIFKQCRRITDLKNQAVITGAVFGLWIFVCYAVSYFLLEML